MSSLATEVFLVLTLTMSDGSTVPGEQLEGWGPRPQPSMEVCEQRARFAEKVAPPVGVSAVKADCETWLEGADEAQGI